MQTRDILSVSLPTGKKAELAAHAEAVGMKPSALARDVLLYAIRKKWKPKQTVSVERVKHPDDFPVDDGSHST